MRILFILFIFLIFCPSTRALSIEIQTGSANNVFISDKEKYIVILPSTSKACFDVPGQSEGIAAIVASHANCANVTQAIYISAFRVTPDEDDQMIGVNIACDGEEFFQTKSSLYAHPIYRCKTKGNTSVKKIFCIRRSKDLNLDENFVYIISASPSSRIGDDRRGNDDSLLDFFQYFRFLE
jgi:hypothetical protein